LSTPTPPPLRTVRDIREEGDAAFRNGTVKLLDPDMKALQRRAIVSICCHPLAEFMLWQTYRAALIEGFNPLTADLHYPLHFSVLEATCPDPVVSREDLWSDVSQFIFSWTARTLDQINPCNIIYNFDELIVDGSGRLLLTASVVEYAIREMRSELIALYEKHDLKVIAPDNFLEMTVLQLRPGPFGSTAESLKRFHDRLWPISQNLRCNCGMNVIGWKMYAGAARDLFDMSPE
jgi:hypothetical protein